MEGITEIIRLVGLVDPDTHNLLAQTFKFYRVDAEKNDAYYRKIFIEDRVYSLLGYTYENTLFNSKLHSYKDEPAQIIWDSNGNAERRWCNNGLLHRKNGPAIIYRDGKEEWYQNGLLHRKNGPAIIYRDGKEEWYQNGLLHRNPGPAIIYGNGKKEWYLYGKRHNLPYKMAGVPNGIWMVN